MKGGLAKAEELRKRLFYDSSGFSNFPYEQQLHQRNPTVQSVHFPSLLLSPDHAKRVILKRFSASRKKFCVVPQVSRLSGQAFAIAEGQKSEPHNGKVRL